MEINEEKRKDWPKRKLNEERNWIVNTQEREWNTQEIEKEEPGTSDRDRVHTVNEILKKEWHINKETENREKLRKLR